MLDKDSDSQSLWSAAWQVRLLLRKLSTLYLLLFICCSFWIPLSKRHCHHRRCILKRCRIHRFATNFKTPLNFNVSNQFERLLSLSLFVACSPFVLTLWTFGPKVNNGELLCGCWNWRLLLATGAMSQDAFSSEFVSVRFRGSGLPSVIGDGVWRAFACCATCLLCCTLFWP